MILFNVVAVVFKGGGKEAGWIGLRKKKEEAGRISDRQDRKSVV